MITNIKIENMREQLCPGEGCGAVPGAIGRRRADALYAGQPEREYGFVAVTRGRASKAFCGFWAGQCGYGGQTMNPSTRVFLQAVHATPPNRFCAAQQQKYHHGRGADVLWRIESPCAAHKIDSAGTFGDVGL
jgi:dihydroxyacetone kinase-like predicted kinase